VRVRGALIAAFAAAATAMWAAPSAQAVFTQCPPVDADAGCQFLITVTDSGPPSVTPDSTQGPYEVEDDSLIGVQNSSSKALTALPLSAPNSSLFGFEGDGLCNPGKGPIAPGCVPVPGSPAGTTCEARSLACSFPPSPGEPPNYQEGGATGALAWPNGDRQNGYEGPTSWFSGIPASPALQSSGTVNFSPPIQPGAASYFSLESPPTGSTIQVGTPATTPPAGGTAPPTKLPPAFGKNGIVEGLPSNKVCLSKRHFMIHLRRYAGITYASAFVFVNRKSVKVTKEPSGRFAALIDLRGLPAGTFPVKITAITTTGGIITGQRTYKTCHRKVGFHGKGIL
jgi:hypothetical protein